MAGILAIRGRHPNVGAEGNRDIAALTMVLVRTLLGYYP
jgi:hypothetical protein